MCHSGSGKLYEFYLKHGGPANRDKVMRAAIEHGVDFGVEDVRGYLEMGFCDPRPSRSAVELIGSRLNGKVNSLYDPWAVDALLILSLVESHNPAKVYAYQDRHPDKHIRSARHADKVEWLGRSSSIVGPGTRHDAIVSCFPTFVRTDFFGGRMGERQVADNACLQLVVDACNHLTDDGVAAFILPDILTAVQYARMVENLSLNGIYLHELVCIKGGAYDPYGWGGNLIVLRREAPSMAIAREIGSPEEGIDSFGVPLRG